MEFLSDNWMLAILQLVGLFVAVEFVLVFSVGAVVQTYYREKMKHIREIMYEQEELDDGDDGGHQPVSNSAGQSDVKPPKEE